jgi:hypothetical protein
MRRMDLPRECEGKYERIGGGSREEHILGMPQLATATVKDVTISLPKTP